MWIPRTIAAHVQSLGSQFPAILLTGARQTGKTSLLKNLFPHYNYVTLDSIPEVELAEKDPEEFFRRHPAPLIIDEFQHAPEITRTLKGVIDGDRHKTGQFILIGTQKFTLMPVGFESLAGRMAIVDLENLSCAEIAPDLAPMAKNLPRLVTRGGFPDLWRNPELDATAFYNSYVQTYIEHDLRQLIQVTKPRDFDRFLRLLATRHGHMVNKADLAKDLALSPSTVAEWLNALIATNIIEELPPFYINLGKRITKSPKIYFQDSGLVSHLLAVNEHNYLTSPFLGYLWEGFVYGELRKSAPDGTQRIYFYRDQQSREVDFLVIRDGRLKLLEVKWHAFPNVSEAKNLFYLEHLCSLKADLPFTLARSGFISSTDRNFPLNHHLEVLSIGSLQEVWAKKTA